MSDKPKLHMITGEFAAASLERAEFKSMPCYVLGVDMMKLIHITKSIKGAGVVVSLGIMTDNSELSGGGVALLKVRQDQLEQILERFDPIWHESISDYKEALENNNP